MTGSLGCGHAALNQGHFSPKRKVVEGGKKVGEEKVKNVKITFVGDKIEIEGLMQDKGKGTFTLDPTKKPKAIDIRIPNEEDVAGIYEFDGKALKLCLNTSGSERPKEFTGKGKQILLLLKR